jgi:hypothetical protein
MDYPFSLFISGMTDLIGASTDGIIVFYLDPSLLMSAEPSPHFGMAKCDERLWLLSRYSHVYKSSTVLYKNC